MVACLNSDGYMGACSVCYALEAVGCCQPLRHMAFRLGIGAILIEKILEQPKGELRSLATSDCCRENSPCF